MATPLTSRTPAPHQARYGRVDSQFTQMLTSQTLTTGIVEDIASLHVWAGWKGLSGHGTAKDKTE